MITDSAQPLQIYPDQFIPATWPGWVNTYLSKVPPDEFHTRGGFQGLLQSDNSSDRSRAVDIYRLGLIVQRIVAEQSSGRANIPMGWASLCADKSILSRIGYLAYAVGNALSIQPNSPDIRIALNVLHLVFALGVGTTDDGIAISTALVYKHVTVYFKKNIDFTSFSQKKIDYFDRVLACAIFATLEDSAARKNLLNEYINGKDIESLVLKIKDKPQISLTVKNLTAQEVNITDLECQKSSLYWMDSDRGIFKYAEEIGGKLISRLVELDIKSLKNNNVSVLDSAFELGSNGEYFILERLTDVMKSDEETSIAWESLMEKLVNGVYAALAYLEDTSVNLGKKATFHLHGAEVISDGMIVEGVDVVKVGMPLKPDIGAILVVQGVKYKIRDIEDKDTLYRVKLEVIQDPSLV